jgi:hypothetical protein
VAKQGEHGVRRQARFEVGRSGGRAGHRRPLHPSPRYDLCHTARGIRAADRSERIQSRDLFGQRAAQPVAGESAAVVFQYRDRGDQATASGFLCEGWAVSNARRRNGRQQGRIVELSRGADSRPCRLLQWGRRREARPGKQVELALRRWAVLSRWTAQPACPCSPRLSTLSVSSVLTSSEDRFPRSSRCAPSHVSAV